MRTFQERLVGEFPDLDDLACRFGAAERTAYARAADALRGDWRAHAEAVAAGRKAPSEPTLGKALSDGKKDLCSGFDLPARLVNSLRVRLMGMAESKREKAKHDLADVESKLEAKAARTAKAKAKFDALDEAAKSRKARKAATKGEFAVRRLEGRAHDLREVMADPHPSICFGTRRLFNASNHLPANRYADHGEWKADWTAARASELFVLGSGDEPGGNKTCRATIRRVRLEDWFAEGAEERRRNAASAPPDSDPRPNLMDLRGDGDRLAMLRRMAEGDGGFVECVDLSLALTAEKELPDATEDGPAEGPSAEGSDGAAPRMRKIPPRRLLIRGLILPHGHMEWLEAIKGAEANAKAAQAWQRETAVKIKAGDIAVSDGRRAWNAAQPDSRKKGPEALFRAERAAIRRKAEKDGWAVSYRFVKDRMGWRVMPTISQNLPDAAFDRSRGVLGVDFNLDHLAVVETDASGNFLSYHRIELPLRGKTAGQRSAAMRDACHAFVLLSFHLGKPIVIESLDFRKKKRALADADPSAARRLSSLSCAAFHRTLRAHARLRGIAVEETNPSWTSVQGAVVHAARLGLTVHGAAALVVARRGMGLPEPWKVWAKVLLKGKVVRLDVASNAQRSMGKDRADDWNKWAKAIKTAHAARSRSQTTGRKERAAGRAERDFRLDSEFLSGPVANPGGTPGETNRAAMVGAPLRSAA